MPDVSRRALLRALGVGAAAAAAFGGYEYVESGGNDAAAKSRVARKSVVTRRYAAHPSHVIPAENARRGSTAWRIGSHHTRSSTDDVGQIKGFTSKTSVRVGESIDFHVSVDQEQLFTIDIYRFGWYAGAGARHVMSSPRLRGKRQPSPRLDPDFGTITCPWTRSWTVRAPASWTSGLYLGVMTSAAGYRNYVPFVVRDDRPADLLVVVPFTTYQAYNQFPLDRRVGKSLYYGYLPEAVGAAGVGDASAISYTQRAVHVSFDRPFADNGWPHRADEDQSFAFWAERQGYDLTYATSLDLHSGRLDLSQYAGVVFSGHDEYWSEEMRRQVTAAVAGGTSLAYMSANNVYWHVRCDRPTSAGEVRSMYCYKSDPDPTPDASGATTQWRLMGPGSARAEQGLLGVQYNGIVPIPCPLIVRRADHWMWKGTGVAEGERLAALVGGEADGFAANAPRPAVATQTLLSASPFIDASNDSLQIQNTSVCEMASGAMVFVAATMNWTSALGKLHHTDHRVQNATANVFGRILHTAVA